MNKLQQEKKVSRQRKWQLKQRSLGKCTNCAQDARLNKWGTASQYCDFHYRKLNIFK